MGNFRDLYGIGFGCPFMQRCVNCPINEIDNLPFKEKVKWIDDLKAQQRINIQQHHQACSAKREKMWFDE